MRRLRTGAVAGVCACALVAIAARASMQSVENSEADNKLRGDLLQVVQQAPDEQMIPISIVLADQVSRDAIDRAIAGAADKATRRAAVITLLKEKAAATQSPLLDLLRDAESAGEADGVRSMWLANVLITKANRNVIQRVADRAEVGYINHDQPVGDELFPVLPGDGDGDPSSAIECGVDVMDAPRVWDELDITGRGAIVAVIDTGCCITHPDLRDQIWVNPNEIPNNNIDDDNNGFIDDINGWNFETDNNNISDSNSHGTHVAGTVGGNGANGEQTGVAPEATLMICKFWNSFSGESSVWRSMEYATDNGADVTTASLGWPHNRSPDRVMWRTICENTIAAGLVVVYAAGNEGGGNPPDNVRTPGDVPSVLTIGATDCNHNIASFSSRGPITWQGIPPYDDCPYPPGCIKPTVSAPGVDTLSTSNNCSSYTTKSGTSMATPHVAGAVALMLEANPDLTHEDVVRILQETAVDRGAPGEDNDYGAGRVDAFEAVSNSGSSDECSKIKKLRGRCTDRGKIVGIVRYTDTSWDGRFVTLGIDGFLISALVDGRKARVKQCCYEPGDHTVSYHTPPGCVSDKTVTCP